MNDVDRWIYFDGPVPATVRPLLDAMDEVETPRPTAEDKARITAELLAKIDARFGFVREGQAEAERVRAAAPVVERSTSPSPSPPSSARVSFEAWAELSIRLLGARDEDKRAALGARGLSVEEWARIDAEHFGALSEDLRAGRTERRRVYAAKCDEEMARRAGRGQAGRGQTGRGEEEAEAPAREALVPEPPAVMGSAGGPASRSLKSTAEALDLPASVREAMGKLPFTEAPAGDAAPRKKAAGTVKLPVMSSRRLEETLPIGSDAIQKAVAAVPFVGATGGAAVVPFPALTVNQYVSLRFEMQMRPEAAAETLRKYGVPGEASRRALEEHWQRLVAERPEVRAAVEAAVAGYVEWLRGPRR